MVIKKINSKLKEYGILFYIKPSKIKNSFTLNLPININPY